MWVRASEPRKWYWRSTVNFLDRQPDRGERLSDLFYRYRHASLGGSRYDLDYLSYLVETGELSSMEPFKKRSQRSNAIDGCSGSRGRHPTSVW